MVAFAPETIDDPVVTGEQERRDREEAAENIGFPGETRSTVWQSRCVRVSRFLFFAEKFSRGEQRHRSSFKIGENPKFNRERKLALKVTIDFVRGTVEKRKFLTIVTLFVEFGLLLRIPCRE